MGKDSVHMAFLQSSAKWKDFFLRQLKIKHSIQIGRALDPNNELIQSSATTGLVEKIKQPFSFSEVVTTVRKNKLSRKAKKSVKSKTNGKRRGHLAAPSKKENIKTNSSRRKKKRVVINKSLQTIF